MKTPLLLLLAVRSPEAAVIQPPVLVLFAINDSAARVNRTDAVVLSHRVVGARPTHYRVSTRADFSDAAWTDYLPAATWNGARSGGAPCGDGNAGTLLRLFFQVRTIAGQEVRIVSGHRTMVPVHIESNVLGDAICVEPGAVHLNAGPPPVARGLGSTSSFASAEPPPHRR